MQPPYSPQTEQPQPPAPSSAVPQIVQRPPGLYVTPRRLRRRSGFWLNVCPGCCLGAVFFFGGILCLFLVGIVYYLVAPPETTSILILGSDARPDTNEDEIARTDTIMVLSINPRQHEISLFSLPRDVFIDSPQYGTIRANTILRNAELSEPGTGVDAMIEAMEYTFGFEIDHYSRVNFTGFVDLVDALGGVNIDVPNHIVDYEYPTDDYGTMQIEFQSGEQHMDGETALIYARTRHADSDYERAERQQQVMSAVIGKLVNPLNFYRYPGVIQAFTSNFESDMNPVEAAALTPAIVLYAYDSDNIQRLVVDRDYIYGGGSGEALPNVDKIRPWVEAHMQ
ncbi:MAG TPA: LCP family protein [Aggregatilineales bacterium]|nr:LCP family protein [Aggregatilineales bacterium]